MGEENVKQKMIEYSKTQEGQKNWGEDMSGVSQETTTPTPPTQPSSDNGIKDDPLSKMLKSLLGG
jgi:hypothetical protein